MAKAASVASSRSSASWTTARPLPVSGRSVKTSSQVSGRPSTARASTVEVEVPRGTLLEPEAVVLGRLLEELRRLLQHVLGLAVAVGRGRGRFGRGRLRRPL